VPLTLFADAFDRSEGELAASSWDEFVGLVVNACAEGERGGCVARDGDKRTLPALLPAVTCGARRKGTDYVAHMSPCVVLDLDDIPQAELDRVLADLYYTSAVVYASPSDGTHADPLLRRVRVIVRVQNAYPAEVCARARLGLCAMLGIDPVAYGVSACLEPERLFFIGSLDGTLRDTWTCEGSDILDVDELVALAPNTPLNAGVRERFDRPEGSADEAWIKRMAELVGPAYSNERQSWFLQFLGWTGRFMSEADHTALVWELQAWNGENHHKFLAMVERAEVLDGPAACIREALGSGTFLAVDQHLHTHPNAPPIEPPAGAVKARELAKVRAQLVDATIANVVERHAELLADPRMADAPEPAAAYVLDGPGIIQVGDRACVRLTDDGTYTPLEPIGSQSLRNDLRDHGGHLGLYDHKGKRRGTQDVLDEHSVKVPSSVASYTAEKNTYDPYSDTLECATLNATRIAPRFDADVQGWLIALFGGDLMGAYQWIRSLDRALLNVPAVALCLRGNLTTGKTLFANMCARLLGAEAAVPLANVARQFNSAIESCPVVLDDECRALKSRKLDITTDYFREMVASSVQHSEAKGVDVRAVRGALRMIFTANEDSDFKFSDGRTGRAGLDAVADRLAVYVADAEACDTALEKLRGAYGRADEGRILGHLAWVVANTTIRATKRFLGKAGIGQADRAVEIAYAAAIENETVLEVLSEALERPDAATDGHTGEPRVIVRADAVYARVTAMWGNATQKEVAEALRPFVLERGRVVRVSKDRTCRMWLLDAERLRRAIRPHGEIVDLTQRPEET
jgi:hypothetical protein